MNQTEVNSLETRLQRLAAEKSYLQLLVNMMERLSALPGLTNLAQNLLRGITNNIGGTNQTLYYRLGKQLKSIDLFDHEQDLEQIDDPLVQQVFATGEPVVEERELRHSQLVTPLTGQAWTWIFPLKVGESVIGVIRMENLNLDTQGFAHHLPTFFRHAALVLNNEIQSQLRFAEVNRAKEAAEAVSRAKSRFLEVMSHELRTPLNGILVAAELLEDSVQNLDDKGLASIIHVSGKALLAIIQEILDFANIEGGRMRLRIKEINLPRLLANEMNLIAASASQKGLNLQCQIAPQIPPMLWGDGLRLGQVVSNLLSNAVKFTEQGSILLQANLISENENEIQLEILVSDSGVGIPQEQLGKVFEPFSQADQSDSRLYPGAGVGLSIVHDIVQLMLGQVTLQSSLGVGTQVRVQLPLAKSPPKNTAPVAHYNPVSVGKAT